MADQNSPSRLFQRIGLLIQDSLDFIGECGLHMRERVVVKAVPRVDADKKRVVYIVRVRGELVPVQLEHRLSGILFQARATLDRAMFTAATASQAVTYTKSEELAVSFPIATTEPAWDKVVRQKHMQALGPSRVARLRTIQPFVTGRPIATILNDLHRFDKHREPLELVLIADPQFPMVFDHILEYPGGFGEFWIDFFQPNPPLEDGLALVERRSTRPVVSAGIEDVHLACAATLAGDLVDVQDLLWDAMEFVVRAAEILEEKRSSLADSMAAYIHAERRQLAAFQRGMLENEWGEWVRLAQPERSPGSSFRAIGSPKPLPHAPVRSSATPTA